MDLNWNIECPYCHKVRKVDLSDYVEDTSSYERQMGREIQYSIECENFECSYCHKEFKITGSIWEYPEGAYNHDDIKVISNEEDED